MFIDNFQNDTQKSEGNENQKKGSTRSSGVSGLIEKIKQQNQTSSAAISSSSGEFVFLYNGLQVHSQGILIVLNLQQNSDHNSLVYSMQYFTH